MLSKAAGALMLICLPTAARASEQIIGDWFVQVEKDPFSTKKKTLALSLQSPKVALSIRCLGEDGLSVGIFFKEGANAFEPGHSVYFKYRADEGAIIEDKGEAFGDHMVELPIARQVLEDAGKAGSLYFRMQTPENAFAVMTFKTRGAAKALAGIKADCPAPPAEKEPK